MTSRTLLRARGALKGKRHMGINHTTIRIDMDDIESMICVE